VAHRHRDLADRDAVSPTATDPVRFDPFDPGFTTSPFEQYAALRDLDPLHRSALLCAWIVTRYDDVDRILRDPTMSSDVRKATPSPITELELTGLAAHPRATRTIVHLDDPDHARVRKLMAEPFRVRQIARLTSLIEARVTDAFDRLLAEHGPGPATIDLVSELAYPLPVEIFSAWLGVPEEAHPQFREWTSWVARSRDPLSPADRDRFFGALDAMCDYLADQAEAKRRAPADDLLSYLVQAEDGGAGLSADELLSQLVTLYMAGHEPTAGLVGNGMLALLRHPDQLAALQADGALLRNGVSELLRYDGPNQFVRRITTQPTTVAGTELPSGEVLFVGLASANRDPRRWGSTADSVVVGRADAGDHLQFGGGAHACIGSHLARLQAEVFLRTLLTRLQGLELAAEPVWSTRMFIRGLSSLPVRATIAAA